VFGPTLRGELISLEPPSHELIQLVPRWFADTDVNLYTFSGTQNRT
jgi:hypothetical protein